MEPWMPRAWIHHNNIILCLVARGRSQYRKYTTMVTLLLERRWLLASPAFLAMWPQMIIVRKKDSTCYPRNRMVDDDWRTQSGSSQPINSISESCFKLRHHSSRVSISLSRGHSVWLSRKLTLESSSYASLPMVNEFSKEEYKTESIPPVKL